MRGGRHLLLLTAVSMSAPAFAAKSPPSMDQAGSQMVIDVTACRKITDSAARLACYDASVSKLADATERKDVVVLDREDVRKTKRSLFGFNVPSLPFFGGGKDADGKEAHEEFTEIEAKIASVRDRGMGVWTIVLDDGGVWETNEAPKNDPSSGDSIHIRKAALGSYFGNINGARAVRLHRIG